MCITANKYPGVRAVVCNTADEAVQAREHLDANILVLGEKTIIDNAEYIMNAWFGINAQDGDDGRHARRRKQIEEIEKSLSENTSYGALLDAENPWG